MEAPLKVDTTTKAAATATQADVEDGGLTVCLNCDALLIHKGEWRAMSDTEWLDMGVDERKVAKDLQTASKRVRERKAGKTESTKEGVEAASRLMAVIPEDMAALLPWIVGLKMMREKKTDKERREIILAGVLMSVQAISERKETSPEDDLALMSPLIMASAYLEKDGNMDEAIAMVRDHIRNRCEKKGIPAALIEAVLK